MMQLGCSQTRLKEHSPLLGPSDVGADRGWAGGRAERTFLRGKWFMFLKVEFYVFTLLALCKKTGNKNIWFSVAFRNCDVQFATILWVFFKAEARALMPLTYVFHTNNSVTFFITALLQPQCKVTCEPQCSNRACRGWTEQTPSH